jgi:probable HAF family extracellular repeat protein
MTKNRKLLLMAASTLLISASQSHAVEYDFTTLNFAGMPLGINDAGVIVGTNGSVGFEYSGGVYTTFGVPSAGQTAAYGINNSGKIAGYSFSSSLGASGFLKNGGSYSSLNVPAATGGTWAYGINDRGQIVGQFNGTSVGGVTPVNAFVYSNGSYTVINAPSATTTVAYGINNAGKVVGIDNAGGNAQAFLYGNGTFQNLNIPNAIASYAHGINDLNQIVGFYQLTAAQTAEGFVYSGGTITTLTDPLATNGTFATGINDAGDVVGYYYVGNNLYPFEATPVSATPLPSTWTMMLIGLAGLGVFAHRRKNTTA